MALLDPAVCLTYDDYLLFPEDGRRHEIIEGEHYVSPAPNRKHQRILATLSREVGSFVHLRGLGEVLFAPFDVVFSDVDIVQPDLIFVASANLGILTEANAQGAPDLVVEILSESTRKRDLTTKRKLYARSGVAEYWVIDPEIETVTVFRIKGELVRSRELALETGDHLESPLLPGFELKLSELFGG